MKLVRNLQTLVVLLIFTCSLTAHAEWVSVERAMQTAQSFWHQKVSRNSANGLRLAWDNRQLHPQKRSAGEQPLYYVFRGETNGFLILSAEDQVQPILAYAFDSEMSDPADLPDGLKEWLTCIERDIQTIRQAKIANPKAQEAWNTVLKDETAVLLETAKWDQGAPYNDQLPKQEGVKCLTGCVNTALAIVLRYYKWPKQGKGTIPAYKAEYNNIYVPERDLNHKYDWEHMPLTYRKGHYSIASANAVSTLMADVACSNHALFGKNSTSTMWSLAYTYKHFDFGPTIQSYNKEELEENAWYAMLEKELSERRPVVYSASNHMFLLDGYTDSHYYHVNWGWSGTCDGYYSLSHLIPQSGRGYDGSDQTAYIHVRPNTGNFDEDLQKQICAIYSVRLLEEIDDFTKPFKIFILRIYNRFSMDFTGHFKIVHMDRQGKIKSSVTPEIPFQIEGHGEKRWDEIEIKVTEPIEKGDKLHFLYKSEKQTEWYPIEPTLDLTDLDIPIHPYADLASSTSLGFNKETGRITLRTKWRTDVHVYDKYGRNVHDVLKHHDEYIKTIDTKKMENGTYEIRLTKDEELKKIKISIKH